MSSSDELDDIEYTPEPESDDENNHKNDIVSAKQAIPQQAPTNDNSVIPSLQVQETQLSPSNNTQQAQPKELPPALRARLAKRGILPPPTTALFEERQQQQQSSSPSQVKLKRDVSLPPGWFESYDQRYRHKYYYNPTTLERTWLKPFLSLPPGWKAAVDENSGCVYYYSYKTGERQWLPPSSSNNGGGGGGGKKALVNSKEVKPQAKGVGVEKKPAIDPMDPSAYSDAPVGGWNVGQEAAADRGGE